MHGARGIASPNSFCFSLQHACERVSARVSMRGEPRAACMRASVHVSERARVRVCECARTKRPCMHAHACVRASVHAVIRASVHAYEHAGGRAGMRVSVHACKSAGGEAGRWACVCACMPGHSPVEDLWRRQSRPGGDKKMSRTDDLRLAACTHECTHTRTHAHTHARTCTHAQVAGRMPTAHE